jgi:hypothetical protein
MPAPRDIVDSLECVTSVYFSDVRHRNRAAFILADELVEMCCKALAIAANPNLGHIQFPTLLRHPAVQLTPQPGNLGETLLRNHQTRNQMQHGNAAFTVDDQHCADAILDSIAAVEHCFPGTLPVLPDVLKVAARVVRLHSSQGNPRQRGDFEDAMRGHGWNGNNRRARVSEPPYPVGSRRYWGLVLFPEFAQVEGILNRLGIP